MAIVANTFLTYSQIGQREHLANKIYDISPVDTPFTNAIEKVKATARLHEWQTDALAAAATNAQLEGDEVSFTAITPTVRLTNRCQISRKDCIVSGSADAVDTAGREKESLYQIARRSLELKRDREKILTNNQAKVTGNSTTAPQLAGIEAWIATNDVFDGVLPGASPTGDGSNARTDGTKRAVTEAYLKTCLAAIADSGGQAELALVGSYVKQAVSAFTGGSTRFDKSEDKKLTAAVDVYVSDFGTLQVKFSRFSRSRSMLIIDPSMWALAELRKMKTVPLAKTGDADKAMIITEYTLEARNEKASGGVFDLNDS